MGKNLEQDLEKLFKKHGIEKATVIIELEAISENGTGKTSIITMAPTPDEEKETGAAYAKLASTIGNLSGEAIAAASTVIEHTLELHKDLSERSISQVTWDKIAHGLAEAALSPEDYEKLMGAKELKDTAIRYCEYETAAMYREREKEYLQKAMDKSYL